jgi:NaMN:DMB phosphoribosyltransferase
VDRVARDPDMEAIMNPNHPNPDEKKKIEFENGKQALLTTIDITANPLNVLEKLGVEPPQSVIVLAGGANTVGKDQMRRLEPLFTLGIARAAQNRKAVIIDGGTK